MACKGFSTDGPEQTSIWSVLFLNSICFWTSARCKVVNISVLYEEYVDGKFEACTEEVLQELIQQDESHDEE